MNEDKCKICNEDISNVDVVKACPKCGEIYHKSCYEVNGCQNYSCSAKSAGGYCDSCGHKLANNAIFCTNCGKKINHGKNICRHCGSTLQEDSEFCPICGFSQKPVEGITEEEVKTNTDIDNFVGAKAYYYRPKFKEMEITKNPISWNWCGFLFTAYWLAYRKQYFLLFIYELVVLVTFALILSGIITEDIEIILGIALSVFTGLFGNYLYMKKVNKNVEMMKNMNEDQKYYHCISKGGTSGWMIFIYIIITFICEALLLSFFS